jgi:hypothetical protein
MNPRLIAAVSITIASSLAHADTISHLVQWKSSDGGNDHYYGVIGSFTANGLGLTWDDARQQAVSLGGDLVSITSAAENEFVYSNIASDTSLWHSTTGGSYCYAWGPWIGLNAASGSWQWSDGSSYSFSAWAPAEPYEGTWGWVQYYRSYQNWGPPQPDSNWDNTGSDRGMFAIVEWTSNPIPSPSAFAIVTLSSLCTRRRRD